MASWGTYLQVFAHIALLFFFVPIRINGPDELEIQFQDYLKKFNKTYDDPKIYQSKFQAFKKSLEVINTYNLNKSNDSAHYGFTKFSDMLPEEFLHNHLQPHLSQRLSKYQSKSHHKRYVTNLPKKIDWRMKGVVSRVQDQGKCGACWAFSTVEVIESMYAIKNGKLEEFSVKEIVECAGVNNGCKGGDICSLLYWMKQRNFILHRNSDYSSNNCKMNSSFGVQIKDFMCESLVDEEDILMDLLVRNGPLAVAVNAQTWQNYIGGVIEYHCDGDLSQLNHAVQIVGYDLTANIPHYIVRNTWGEDFGDGGYLYLAVNKNMCGLANEVSALRIL